MSEQETRVGQAGTSLHYIYGELVTFLAILGTFMDYLPKVAALVAILWYIILIVESRTGTAILIRLRIKNELDAARQLIRAETQSAQVDLRMKAVEAAEIVKEHAAEAAKEIKEIAKHD